MNFKLNKVLAALLGLAVSTTASAEDMTDKEELRKLIQTYDKIEPYEF